VSASVITPRWQMGLGRENGITFWAMILLEGSFASYFIFLPLYVAQLGANPAQVGIIMGVWGLTRLIFLAPSGILVDRFPTVPLIVITRALGVLGLIVASILPVWWLMPIPLLLTGAANIAFPAISVSIAGAANDGSRARAFTLLYTVAPAIATVIAPLLSGQAAETVGLRVTMLIGAGFASLSILAFSRLHSRPRAAANEIPATYREALAYRPVRNLCLLLAITLLTLTIGTTLASNFLHQVHGLEYNRIGQFGSVAAVGSILLGILFGRVKRLGRPLTGITVATTCTAAMFALLMVVSGLPLLTFAYLLRGGYMVAWSLFSAALGDVTPPRLYGRTFALGEFCGGVGMALAPLLAGPLYEWRPTAPFAVALAFSVPLIALIATLARQANHAPAPTPEIGIVESVA
jgi:DHA1 family multidrug resistance protein-like MFS transporter